MNLKSKNGITLIALVITIIVLLILAGVSINAVIGENGVATKAKKAAEQTEIATEKEQVTVSFSSCKADNIEGNGAGFDGVVTASQLETEMNAAYGAGTVDVSEENTVLTVKYQDTGREYIVTQSGGVIKFDDYTEPHSEQSIYNSAIGIDINGNLVNMDNWLFYYDSNLGGYVLAGIQQGSGSVSASYVGDIVNGRIEGNVPMYIMASSTQGSYGSSIGSITYPTEFKPVVSMVYTFAGLTSLEHKPEIPPTVEEETAIYDRCTNLIDE